MIKIANAPCSWGVLEFDLAEKSEEKGFQEVLDEIEATGYVGTELGDWGFMPSEPIGLRKEIEKRKLELVGAFVPVDLSDKDKHDAGVVNALKTAKLMSDANYKKSFIVLADDNGSNSERTLNAGRVDNSMMLSEEQWKVFAHAADRIARAVKEEYGLRTVFHHHCAGFIETPEEIDQLMELTDPHLLGLCLDMGHYAFGGGDPLMAIEKHKERIWHVHFKDYDPLAAQAAKEEGEDYFGALKRGVFCELGEGIVDFQSIVSLLKKLNYKDWIVVEQDVLPGMGNPKNCALKNRKYIKTLGL